MPRIPRGIYQSTKAQRITQPIPSKYVQTLHGSSTQLRVAAHTASLSTPVSIRCGRIHSAAGTDANTCSPELVRLELGGDLLNAHVLRHNHVRCGWCDFRREHSALPQNLQPRSTASRALECANFAVQKIEVRTYPWYERPCVQSIPQHNMQHVQQPASAVCS